MDQTTIKIETRDEERNEAVHLAPTINESHDTSLIPEVKREDRAHEESPASYPSSQCNSSVNTGVLMCTVKQEPNEQDLATHLSLSLNDTAATDRKEPVPVSLYKVTAATIKTEYTERHRLESDTTYSIIKELQVSISEERGKKELKCTLCPYTTTWRGSLTRHRRIHSPEKLYKCYFCAYSTSRKDTLKKHEAVHRVHSETGENKKSATTGNWIQHETPNRCSPNPISTSLKPGLRKREAKRKNMGLYKCSLCPYYSEREVYLRKHEQIHDWQPSSCSPTAATNTQIAAPDKMETCSKDVLFRCLVCAYSTTDEGKFCDHKRRHRKKNRHKCSLCTFSGSSPSHLKIHKRTHTGEKPYKCSICDYSTAHKKDLREHEQTCSAERQYSCAVCEYRTGSKVNLRMHERSHANVILYQCSHCPYSTDNKGNISRHEKNHNADKPFRCSVCLYSADRLGSITKHEMLHCNAEKRIDLSLLLKNVGPSSETRGYMSGTEEKNCVHT